MADGLFYVDAKPPHNAISGSSISLTASYQALLSPGVYPPLGTNYFGYVGKAIRIRVSGQYTTAATPGNLSFAYFWGNGTSNTGTAVAATAVVGTANLTALPFMSEVVVRCRALGVSGSLFAQGTCYWQSIGLVMIPNAGVAAVTVDLTQNFIINVQATRSGSTAETLQIHDLLVEALN